MSDMPSPSPVDAEKQQKDSAWPVPGDEGFVHPDGTPQSVKQLEDNKQAQADRDHVGAVLHGAPLATPGPQSHDVTGEKIANAAKVAAKNEKK
jgi:hypothetical protein